MPETFDLSNPLTFPRAGDRIQAFQFTPLNPTPKQKRDWCRDVWQSPPSDEVWNQCPCWYGGTVIVVRRGKKDGRQVLTVSSPEWNEPLRSQGVVIPLTHVEIIQRSYAPDPIAYLSGESSQLPPPGSDGNSQNSQFRASRQDRASRRSNGNSRPGQAGTENGATQQAALLGAQWL